MSVPTRKRLHELKARHALTGREIAEIVGVNARTVRRWLEGRTPMPYVSWMWLRWVLGEIGTMESYNLREPWRLENRERGQQVSPPSVEGGNDGR